MTTVPVDDLLRACGLTTLGESPPIEAVEASLRGLVESLNGADPLRREAVREGAVQALKAAKLRAPGRLVDAALAPSPADTDSPGSALVLSDPEPWPDPVDGGALLTELTRTFPRFLALPDGAAMALALWVLHSHAHDAATVSPILGVVSPQKRCGKTTLLHLLGSVVPRPVFASNITGPALFRGVEMWQPTLLVDEADSFLRDREDLRGILNSGHHKAGAFVMRTVGDEHEPRLFSTWSAKAVALIGSLPDTLMDRAIEVSMRRRRPGETVERLRLDRLPELEPVRRQAWTWAQANLGALKDAEPSVPEGLNDRQADNWRPLLSIAERIGGPWPERARGAARHLSGTAEDDEAGTLLLEDLRTLFDDRRVDRLPSSEIVEALARMEERPWPEWRRGQPLTARSLARLLKPYGVTPTLYRMGPDRARGYDRGDLEESWTRYLPAGGPPSKRDNRDNPSATTVCGGSPKCDEPEPVTDASRGEDPGPVRNVTDVTGGEGASPDPIPLPDLWAGAEVTP